MIAYTFYESDNRVRRYAETLAKRGDKVDAIVLRRDGDQPQRELRGVRIISIQRRERNERHAVVYLLKLLQFFIRSAWTVTVQHLREPYDLIHVHSVPDFQVFSTVVPKLLGVPIILDIHDIVPEFYASKFRVSKKSTIFRSLLLVEKLSIAFSDHVIIANHPWYEKLIRRSVRPEKCSAIINYPDTTIFEKQASTSTSTAFTIAYPGTLNEHNGVDLAVLAVDRLRFSAPNLKFLIIGDGPDRAKLHDLIYNRGLEDRILLEGSMPMEQVAVRMKTVDLGIVPKRKNSFGNEAFSTKILEFMAMGIPVLVADTAVERYYFNDDLVQFFESGNVDDLAAKILDLLRAPDRRARFRENCLKFIESNHWNARKQDYLELVDRLVFSKAIRTHIEDRAH